MTITAHNVLNVVVWFANLKFITISAMSVTTPIKLDKSKIRSIETAKTKHIGRPIKKLSQLK